jgi:hypothetical protein
LEVEWVLCIVDYHQIFRNSLSMNKFTDLALLLKSRIDTFAWRDTSTLSLSSSGTRGFGGKCGVEARINKKR